MSILNYSRHSKPGQKGVTITKCIPVFALMVAFWLSCDKLCSGSRILQLSEGPKSIILIAQRDQSLDDPHGPDPHGPNPHNEQHDSRLPANEADDRSKAPTDPYGGAELEIQKTKKSDAHVSDKGE